MCGIHSAEKMIEAGWVFSFNWRFVESFAATGGVGRFSVGRRELGQVLAKEGTCRWHLTMERDRN